MQVYDAWAAYQLDRAVSLLGRALENASQELVEVGSGTNKKMEPKYEMEQLLDPLFRLPSSPTRADKERLALQKLKGLRGVKVWRGK